MNILVIQSSYLDPISGLGEHLIAGGARLFTWLPEERDAPPEGAYAGLIVLGGPMNAHEDDKFPHLRATVTLIQQFHAEGKPIMGICLGAQLVARAFGSRVYPHSQPELGFSPLRAIAPAAKEPWLQDFPQDLRIMQWHFDTFDLPAPATLLVTNDICPNQAYRIGNNVYGFQFHLEVTPEVVRNWLSVKSDWIDAHYPTLNRQIEQQLKDCAPAAAQFAQKVARHWLTLVPAHPQSPL